MRKPKRQMKNWLTTICTVLLAAGLFCTQVCQAVCATAACAGEAKVAQPASQLEHGHCHQHTSTVPVQTPAPQPQPKSHDCPSHEFAGSFLPSSSNLSDSAKQHTWQTVFEPFGSTDVILELARNKTAEGLHLKSPPRSPQRTILRI